jgi:hypothetical protein
MYVENDDVQIQFLPDFRPELNTPTT